ncbi:MACPF domain-containing protein At4g24290-like [Durio zibethinus]|uniref:MACPF domain-containing protein At4g24290-like n=1 Tax=Durio zibethinus TaxID=66656 RepID=A0A6P6ACY8_DURZI|nr:MACPF domain-containing protein At4g24290-like [Durio zibethinus]XP_022762754.1 MACPF domain-containing protein At4g24290-like [Durio zibethinus]XP_022762755.1 MACPF domain-containing protein At4g24290-like [Durio zibethinus]XP_022762756.1 MACPF domain-containing protein At4g24290-like [Durio zibethinus]XP_022762757.1 MACPF domain-containing protein At4g24290-like [Durio zibethinus]XP_022762758.1 MACPF domain-containing protein At4g24290-like [Durio zibethinus]
MAHRVPAPKAAATAIGSIGCGYDVGMDLRLRYCKGDSKGSCLIEIDEDGGRDIVLPGGVSIPNVSKSIKCDKGERTRFRSDVLSFQQMSEQFNQELSLTGKIPSGLFNSMFEFSGCWQKDAANTKMLAFDGVFITLYSVALEKSQMVLRDHVKKAVPSTWEPAALARFIDTYGTHIIVGVKMGGKDVVYIKQQHSSTLQPADIQKRLKEMADKRFLDTNGHYSMTSEQLFQSDKFEIREQRLTFAQNSPSSSYAHKEDIISIYKRRGGSDNRNLCHNDWLQTVQSEPDVISMSFIPITSLLNGVPGSGFLSHAINLYLRYKPPIVELHQFLEFQLPRQWAPVFCELPLGLQRKQQSTSSLQFSFMGPKLFVNTTPVDVGKRPVTGLRLYLEGRRSNCLAIHLQHLSSLPKIFQLVDDPNGNFCQESHDRKYYERVYWKNYSHVCTAPVESDEDLSIVTGAQLQVENHGFKNILFLRLRFSTVLGAMSVKHPEWDGSPGLAPKSGLISTLISHHFTTVQKPPPRPADVNINSAVYPGGPPVPVQAPKLLKFVDTTEMTRGPQEIPGYWVVSGARLVVEKGRISLRVKYSLLTAILPDEDGIEEH